MTIKQARVLKGDHQTSQKLVQKLVWIGEFLDGDLPLITAYWTSAIIEGRLRGLSQVIRANPCQGGMRTSTTFGPGRGAVARSASVNPSDMTFVIILDVKFNLIFNVCLIYCNLPTIQSSGAWAKTWAFNTILIKVFDSLFLRLSVLITLQLVFH